MPKVKSCTPRNAVEIETWQFSKPSETFGQLVFAKMNGSLWWPGLVIDGQEWGLAMASLHKQWIFWYGDGRVSQVMVHNICSFRKFYKKLLPAQAGRKYREGIEEAIDDCAFQDGMPSSWDKKEKLDWADNGFESQSTKLELSADLKKSLENVKKVMANYKENESEKERKQYLKDKRMPDGRVEKKRLELVGVKHSHIQSNSVDGGGPKMSLFQKIQNGKVNPKEVCIACRSEKKIIQCQHPVFEGGICDECKVDHCNNIGGMTKEPEKESDKFDADRKRTLQNKELHNPSSNPTHEENSQLKYPKPNSFVVNCFPDRRVKKQKENVNFYAPSNKFSQLNDSEMPVRNHECEELGHQAENTSYPTEFICNYCNTRYSEIYSLALHIKIHVDGMRSARVLPKKEFSPRFSQILLAKAFQCIECGKTFSRSNELNKHSVVHTDEKRFKCNECGKMFTHCSTLKNHLLLHTGVKQFKCNECGKVFTRKDTLKTHTLIHTDVKRFKCNKCGKMFAQSGSLKSHLLVHTSVNKFKCNDCGKTFSRKGHLSEHSFVHTGVKRFKCNECGKMFTQSGNLKTHSLTHTDVKRFKCNECGKMFIKCGNLKNHLLVHSGVKQFKCNEYGNVFTKSGKLKSHLLVHTGVKQFKCNECGMMFTKSSHLKSHSVIHTGVKPFKCNSCGELFKWRSSLRRHLLSHAD